MEKIFEIVQASAALEGCTLTLSECRRLLSQGVSSEGKTISEQLLCINLRAAYEKCFQLAAAREFWSVYRLKSIAALALRDAGLEKPYELEESLNGERKNLSAEEESLEAVGRLAELEWAFGTSGKAAKNKDQ